MVLTVSFALSLVSRAFLPPSPADDPASLISASGYQDHATLPSAGSVVRHIDNARVHRIPHPTFVTIAKRPSCGARDGMNLHVICARDQRLPPAANWHDGQISPHSQSHVKC